MQRWGKQTNKQKTNTIFNPSQEAAILLSTENNIAVPNSSGDDCHYSPVFWVPLLRTKVINKPMAFLFLS